ncbi:MAG: hypothetical protein PHX68_04330 [Alphaproteobacteria bacterium]|nr:hypothetical protein [Alphaproteobacteria bacterium]
MKNKHVTDILFSDLDSPQKKPWYFRKAILFSVFFSIGWLAFVVSYLSASRWWLARFDAAPAELVGNLGGLLLPMVVVWLMSAYFDRSEQLAEESRILQSYLNELVYPTEEGAVYTKTLTDALRAQIKEFRGVFADVTEQTENVRSELRGWISDLGKIINHVDAQTVASIREVAAHIQTLAQATQAANEQTTDAAALFSEQAQILTRVSGQTVQAMGQLTGQMGSRTEEFGNIAHAIENSGDRLDRALTQATQVSAAMQAGSAQIEKVISGYEATTKQQNTRVLTNLEKILTLFRSHGAILEQEVEKTVHKLGVAGSEFIGKAKILAAVSDDAASKAFLASNAFEKSADKIQNAAEWMQKELPAATRASAPARISADVLKDASDILETLQKFSVRLSRLWTPKAEEVLWAKYYAGDKTAFMRHIARALSASQSRKIREFIKKNADFKDAVTRYMRAFEQMTAQAGAAGADNMLVGVLVGSDVGRLYMVLADLLKEGKHAHKAG